MHSLLRASFIALPLALTACGVPRIVTPYRMDIQQGNYISQEMVAQLKPGMSREQVRFVLGTPLVTDVFHAGRWDYVYYQDRFGSRREERRIAVIFEDGKLARVIGDVVPAPSAAETTAAPAGGGERAGAAEKKP
ncbi:MAG: hypothetical protein A3I63_07260 [Betaproteobacteria bacterium RIFCSPLOWO2_02_FULL_66_14]|nr:MAG: hypothetical protein A3I63_07260 [Betaproteobacteria bacterium RIFCSPLOWO2_02_FULL_66_14]